MILYYDLDGKPIGMEEYCELFESNERFIARTDLPGGCMVSTVWLGLDHSFGGGPPLIFESMVFGPNDSTDLDCRRYSTRQEAEDGHAELVTRWTGWTPGEGHPDGAEASFLTQFLNALGQATGERPYTLEESLAEDAMTVMYPKEGGVAERLEAAPDESNNTPGRE